MRTFALLSALSALANAQGIDLALVKALPSIAAPSINFAPSQAVSYDFDAVIAAAKAIPTSTTLANGATILAGTAVTAPTASPAKRAVSRRYDTAKRGSCPPLLSSLFSYLPSPNLSLIHI